MNKKINKFLLIIGIILILLIVALFAVRCAKIKKANEKDTTNEENKSVNGNYSNVKDITLFGKHYDNLIDITEDDIKTHIGSMYNMFTKQSIYPKKNYEYISVIVAFNLLCNEETATIDEIQKYVEKHFGIKDFEPVLVPMKSPFPYEEGQTFNPEILITKDGENYSSNAYGRGFSQPLHAIESIKIKNDQVIVKYVLGYFDLSRPIRLANVKEKVGNTTFYLRYKNGNLIIEKIIYEEVKDTKKD